jgi:hypothetical protein
MTKWGILFSLAVVVLSIFGSLCLFEVLPETPFRDSFLGDWLATITGALVGVPIALALSRWQQRNEERCQQASARAEADEHKSKILVLVEEELRWNQTRLLKRAESSGESLDESALLEGVKDELWRALSDGGELQWIRDLESLDAISLAYHWIGRVKYLEGAYWEWNRKRYLQGYDLGMKLFWGGLIALCANMIDTTLLENLEYNAEQRSMQK